MKKDRREFIKTAGAGMLGAALTGPIPAISAKSYERIIGANDRVLVAIQGLGRRLGGFVEPIVDKKNNVELVYLCDVMKSQREKAAAIFSEKIPANFKLENDIRVVLDDKKVCYLLVRICTTFYHICLF